VSFVEYEPLILKESKKTEWLLWLSHENAHKNLNGRSGLISTTKT